jgi:hypothetical protein
VDAVSAGWCTGRRPRRPGPWMPHGHLPGLDQPGPGIGGSTPRRLWSIAGLGLLWPRFPVGVGMSHTIIGLPLLILVAVVLGRGEGRRGRRLFVGGALGWLHRGRLGASEEGSSHLHLGRVRLPAFILKQVVAHVEKGLWGNFGCENTDGMTEFGIQATQGFTTMDVSEMG